MHDKQRVSQLLLHAHLVLDVKHTLLDLLVDHLGSANEGLQTDSHTYMNTRVSSGGGNGCMLRHLLDVCGRLC